MKVNTVKINCGNIKGWSSFHDEFIRAFGFSDSYKRSLDAWVDCMSSLSSPEYGKTQVHCEYGKVIAIELGKYQGIQIKMSRNIPINWSVVLHL